jgi:hypothetical protein
MGVPPAEFPITVDRASYFIPTVGIAFLASFAGAIAAIIVGMAAAGRGSEPPSDLAFVVWLVASGVGGAAWWVRRRWRIHHERKLLVDAHGITYVKFAGRERLMRWGDIQRVEEVEEYGPDEGHSLIYRIGRRSFSVRCGEFHDYGELRRLTKHYLPERTSLASL